MIVIMLLIFQAKIMVPEDGGQGVNFTHSVYPEPDIAHNT